MKRWQRVRVKRGNFGLSVPARWVGRVVKVDDERSRYGYNILVCWGQKIPRATWVPEAYLEAV